MIYTANVPRGFEDKAFRININIAPWVFLDEGHILVKKYSKIYKIKMCDTSFKF